MWQWMSHRPGGAIRLVARDPVNGMRPSADLLLTTVAKAARERREQKREAAAAETEKRQGEQQETPGEAPGGPAAS